MLHFIHQHFLEKGLVLKCRIKFCESATCAGTLFLFFLFYKSNSLKFQPESQTDGRITTSSENRHVGPDQHVDVLERPHDVSHKVVSQTLRGALRG